MKKLDIYAEYSISRIHSDWACLVSQGYRLGDDGFRSEALKFSLHIMRRVKFYLLGIIDRLVGDGYKFVDESKIYVAPEAGTSDWINEYRNRGIFLPLAFEAWLLEVGSINLIGTHPNWFKPAYFYDGNLIADNILYTDPLVVEFNEDYLRYLYDEWNSTKASVEQDKKIPFRIDISPDYLHKANISGGMPYELDTEKPTVDDVLLNERHATTFIGYIRQALIWKGFPGFDYINAEEKHIWKKDEKIII